MASSLSLWKRCRFQFEILGIHAAAFLVGRLPRPGLLRLARTLSWIAFRVDQRGRAIAEENLSVVFPEHSRGEREALTRESYHHQTMSALDLMWAPRNLTRASEQDSALVSHSFDDAEDFHQIGDGAAIWVTPHYGTFEWLSSHWGLTHEVKPMIVAEDFRNPGLTKIFRQWREYSGNSVIPQERAMVRLFKHVKRGGQTAFLTDLRVKPSKAATIIKCFGRQTCVPIMHAFLAKQTGAPIIPVICLPQADGTYRFHFHRRLVVSPDASPQEIAQQCWDIFEQTIRDQPAPWLWMYKQWRYLPTVPETTYPAYATHSKSFAEIEMMQQPESRHEH